MCSLGAKEVAAVENIIVFENSNLVVKMVANRDRGATLRLWGGGGGGGS